jgi:hypothetical protein
MHPPNPFEESVCQFEQAILWAVYRDAAKTQRKRSLFALRKWPPKVLDGLWRLLRVLEEEAIGSRRYAVERPNGDWWRQVRQHLKQYEAAFGGARPFIAEVASAVAGVTIITAGLVKAFPPRGDRDGSAGADRRAGRAATRTATRSRTNVLGHPTGQ